MVSIAKLEGYEDPGVAIETVMSELDIFVSSTGIITSECMKKLKNNALIGHTSTFDKEIDLRAWKAPEWSVRFLELADPYSVKPVLFDDLAKSLWLAWRCLG